MAIWHLSCIFCPMEVVRHLRIDSWRADLTYLKPKVRAKSIQIWCVTWLLSRCHQVWVSCLWKRILHSITQFWGFIRVYSFCTLFLYLLPLKLLVPPNCQENLSLKYKATANNILCLNETGFWCQRIQDYSIGSHESDKITLFSSWILYYRTPNILIWVTTWSMLAPSRTEEPKCWTQYILFLNLHLINLVPLSSQ